MKFSKGFTLIEALLLASLIGILVAIGIPAYEDFKSTWVEVNNAEVNNAEVGNCIDVELDLSMSTIQQLAVLQVCEDLYGR